MVGEGEVGEEGMCFIQEGLDGGRTEGIRDDEITVAVEGGELVGG